MTERKPPRKPAVAKSAQGLAGFVTVAVTIKIGGVFYGPGIYRTAALPPDVVARLTGGA